MNIEEIRQGFRNDGHWTGAFGCRKITDRFCFCFSFLIIARQSARIKGTTNEEETDAGGNENETKRESTKKKNERRRQRAIMKALITRRE